MSDEEITPKNIISIVGAIFVIIALVFFGIWFFKILWPLIEWAELAGALGWGSSVPILEILQYIFLNVYLICAAVFVIIGGILVAIGREKKA